jgi:hypothetical protein
MNLQTYQFNLGRIVKDELTNRSVQFAWGSKRWTYKKISSIFIAPVNDLTNMLDQFPCRNRRWAYKHISSIFIDLEDELTNKSVQSC